MSLYSAVQLRGPPDDLLAEPGGAAAVPGVDADRLLLLRAQSKLVSITNNNK